MHQPEDVPPAGFRVVGVCRRVVETGVGRNPGEERRLREIQLVRVLLEVRARGLLDAVGAVPEVDGVEVRGENAVLAPPLLELPCERGFPHLPRERPLVPDVGVLDELLRDRRSALDDLSVSHVLPEGARHSADVDPLVLEEALVLDRDDRLAHDRRDVVRADEDAALVATENGEDRAAVRRVDDRVDVRALRGRIEGGDLARDGAHETERERQCREDEENAKQRREAPLANSAPRTRRPLLSPNPQGRQV